MGYIAFVVVDIVVSYASFGKSRKVIFVNSFKSAGDKNIIIIKKKESGPFIAKQEKNRY